MRIGEFLVGISSIVCTRARDGTCIIPGGGGSFPSVRSLYPCGTYISWNALSSLVFLHNAYTYTVGQFFIQSNVTAAMFHAFTAGNSANSYVRIGCMHDAPVVYSSVSHLLHKDHLEKSYMLSLWFSHKADCFSATWF